MSFYPKAKFFQGKPASRDYTPVSAVKAGDLVVIGSSVWIAHSDIPANTLGTVYAGGIYDIAKDSTNFSTDGTAVYLNATGDPYDTNYGAAGTGAATGTAGSNKLIGYTVGTAGATDSTVKVFSVLVPASLTLAGDVSTLIADPGNAAAIPVTVSGYCPIVTAGSETRTLAAPSFVGQRLLLYIKTDGGTCVITVASAINQTGNNTITMADVRDVIQLVAIESGSSKVWHVVSNDGAALSTV